MKIPLVIAFTPNYIVPAAVTLRSIVDSTSDSETGYEVICLVTEEIPDRQKAMLSQMFGERMSFRYLPLAGTLDGHYVDPRYSEAASYRLMLPDLLPDTDRIIYIDCDIIVRQDLSELYRSIDLGDNLLAAIYEAPIEKQSERWAAIGCDPKHYFNSGFLVMNLRQMRKEGTSAKLLEALKVDYLEFPDQDALNQVCQGRALPLSPVYNSIRTFFIPHYRGDFEAQYSAELWQQVQKEGNIHYTGGKPWRIHSVRFADWWKVYDTISDELKAEWNPSKKIRTLAALYRTRVGRFMMEMARNTVRLIKK